MIVGLHRSQYRPHPQLEARHLIGMDLVCVRLLEVDYLPWSIAHSQDSQDPCAESLLTMYSSTYHVINIFRGKYIYSQIRFICEVELYDKLPYIPTKIHVEGNLIKFCNNSNHHCIADEQ